MMAAAAIRGARRSLYALLLGLMMLSAACQAKKLWGVDVGKKEERGEFAALLQKASGEGGGARGTGSVISQQVGMALDALAEADLASMSLSQLCTQMIDGMLELVKDEEWIGQFAEPGELGKMASSTGLSAMLADESIASPEKDDLMELIQLENSPILYKTKFYELVEKWTGKLLSFRMDVADPAKLAAMIRSAFLTAGFDRAAVEQMMEVVEHPEILAAQIKTLASDPTVKQQLIEAAEGFMSAANAMADAVGDGDAEELLELLAAMEKEDPEMMEQMLAELMKDPALLKSLMAEDAEGAGVAGGFLKGMGTGRPGLAAEL